MIRRFARYAFLLMAVTQAPLVSSAFAAWPDGTIHIIAPLPAGSAADVAARLIAKGLTQTLGATVIVDNRDGASGVIGTSQVAHAAPDGFTLGLATSTTLVTAPILNKHTPYDGSKDFTPIAMIGESPYVLVTNAKVPAKTVADFVKLAKSEPGKLTYSSVGEASLARLAAELFATKAGITLNEIPYKSSTQAVVDLISGRIDAQFGILTTTYQFIKEGKLNALGVSTPKRIPEYPDIPTIAEGGLPGYDASLWLAIVAPANLPADIVAKLNKAINATVNDPQNHTVLFNQAIFPEPMTPSQLKDKIDQDITKWKALAVQTGL